MLKHQDVWRAIDRLASESGFSASGLARRAGLDPTTFNKSKRIARDGKPRWPTTESISKILAATNSTMGQFVTLLSDGIDGGVVHRIPIIGYAQTGRQGFFDDAGYPTGSGWDEVDFPNVGDNHAYALEVSGESMEPVYRDGDTIIVSPQANVRRGDRVVVRTKDGEVLAKQLVRQTAHRIELLSINRDHADITLKVEDVEWMARIVWASQ
ncbi:MAG: LexA repressor [Alphaproteobacteria bacterium MarineAlpha10_Bin3]|nr:MAG: LexA repressor [Alphaproteobacteria bacterium MarineAlpha10_Bin3]PPR72475.1 MAG: LexA repressor [Alphaproteobacteria bacterium MarineAlpha4_Bin1]